MRSGLRAWAAVRGEALARSLAGAAIGEGAFAGLAIATALGVADAAASRAAPLDAPTSRWIRQVLSGYLPGAAFNGGTRLGSFGPVFWVALAGLAAALFAFRRTRAARALFVAGFAGPAFVAALGVALYAAVLAPAAALGAGGALMTAAGVRGALERRRGTKRAEGLRGWPARALRRLGAPLLAAAQLLFIAGAEHALARRGEARTRGDLRFLSASAYDLVLAGDPPALVFSDQTEARIARAPYGPPEPAVETLVGETYAERFLLAAEPGTFYLASSAGGVRRVTLGPVPGAVLFDAFESHWPASLAEDPGAGRLLILNEWRGTAAAFRLDAPEEPATFRFSADTWPVPWIAADPPSRRAYVTSMLADGRLRVLDLDTLAFVDERPGLFLYESAVDSARGLLWATRPMPGELVGVDTRTLEVRARIPLAPGTRGVVLDPESGQLFVNTYPYGELFRIDARTAQVLEVGGCGWRCRSLFLDRPRRTLWAASQDGIYRVPLDGAFGSRP